MIKNYLKIKSVLLSDDNIEKVIIDNSRETISIIPRQDLNYNWMEDPLKNFKINGNIKICERVFKVVKYLQNKSKIYELVLKEF